jgi:hypothetical protein
MKGALDSVAIRFFRALAAASAAATLLAGCCGGEDPGDDAGQGDTEWIVWNGSASGAVVTDRNDEQFQVRTSTRMVVARNSGLPLHGTYVDNLARLWIDGEQIGSVHLVSSPTGGQVAVFRCNNGIALDFRADTSPRYSWAC